MRKDMDVRASAERALRQSTEAALTFLLTDIQTANTFLDIAHATGFDSTHRRATSSAWNAYNTVVRLAPRIVITPEERVQLDRKIQELKARLEHLRRNAPELREDLREGI